MMRLVYRGLWCFVLLLTANCGETATPNIYRYETTVNFEGSARTYLLNLPPYYYGEDSLSFPLVIALHGAGGSAHQMEDMYGLTDKANASGFIVVYPEGVRNDRILKIRTWNAGTCCDYAQENNINDVGFISYLIDNLASQFRINTKKVYVTGMSNGGMMAYRLACELSGKITAIAPVSSTMVMDAPCQPSRKVPVLHLHSLQDKKVPYTGGTGIGKYYFPPIDSVLTAWSKIDGCNQTPNVIDNGQYIHTTWQDCTSETSIESYATYDGGHSWPGGMRPGSWADLPSAYIQANELIWNFFQQFELR